MRFHRHAFPAALRSLFVAPGGRSKRQRKARPARSHEHLRLEELEDRTLLSINLTGFPDNWVEQGPGPILNGQTAGLNPDATHPLGSNPVVGAVRAIAPDPNNPKFPNTLYIGSTNGGVWKTTDFLASNSTPTWIPLTDDFESLAIGAVAVSTVNDQYVFAGTGNFSSSFTGGAARGLLISTDAGLHWTQIDQHSILDASGNATLSFDDLSITQIVPSAGNLNEAWLSTKAGSAPSSGGVYHSTDSGHTWSRVSGVGNLFDTGKGDGDVTDFIADPGDSTHQTYFAAVVGHGIYRTTDDGQTWTAQSGQPSVLSRFMNATTGNSVSSNVKLAAALDGGTDSLYLGIIDQNSNLAAFFRAQDPHAATISWVDLGLPTTPEDLNHTGTPTTPVGLEALPFGRLFFSIAADPTDPNRLYVGGDEQPNAGPPNTFNNASGLSDYVGRLFSGEFNPATAQTQWAPIVGNGAAGTAPHADSRVMVFDHGSILEGDDGGIYQLVNPAGQFPGQNWFSLNGNLRITEVGSIAYDPGTGRHVIVSGEQDTGSAEQQVNTDDLFRWNQTQLSFPAQTINGVLVPDHSTTEKGDGNGQAIAVFTQPKNSSVVTDTVRYVMSNNFNFFYRRHYSATGVPDPATVVIPLTGLGANDRNTGSNFFHIPYVVNAVDPSRPLLGLFDLYESPDQGTNVFTLEVLPAAGSSRPRAFVGALAYGGKDPSGTLEPNILYAARGADIIVRTPFAHLNATLAAEKVRDPRTVNEATPSGASTIQAIAMDPNNWQIAYAADNARVFKTINGGQNWFPITGNLDKLGSDFRTIEVIDPTPTTSVVLVGGRGGYFGLSPPETVSPTPNQCGRGSASCRPPPIPPILFSYMSIPCPM
jgi:photosystem II stability/assembly factor-like uncharacterized protein